MPCPLHHGLWRRNYPQIGEVSRAKQQNLENLNLMVVGYELDISLRGRVIEGTHQRWAQINPYVDYAWLRIINHRDHGHPQ
jgi:hypothetical protein